MAILQYLADSNHATELLLPLDDFKRYRVIEWLSFVSSDVHKGFGILFNNTIPQKIKDTIFMPSIKNKFDLLEGHLVKSQFLMGKTFTLADAYLFAVLRWTTYFKIDLSHWTALSRYFADLSKRKSIQEALHEEGLI